MDSLENWSLHKPYRVCETQEFVDRAYKLLGQDLWEEIKDSLDCEIARFPRIPQYRIPEYDSVYGLPISTIPQVVVYYSVNDPKEEIELLEIQSFSPEDYLTYEEEE